MCCGLLLELTESGFTRGNQIQAFQPFYINTVSSLVPNCRSEYLISNIFIELCNSRILVAVHLQFLTCENTSYTENKSNAMNCNGRSNEIRSKTLFGRPVI